MMIVAAFALCAPCLSLNNGGEYPIGFYTTSDNSVCPQIAILGSNFIMPYGSGQAANPKPYLDAAQNAGLKCYIDIHTHPAQGLNYGATMAQYQAAAALVKDHPARTPGT